MPTADTIGLKSSSFGLEDTLFKGKSVMSSNHVVLAQDFVSFSKDLTKELYFHSFHLFQPKTSSSKKINGTAASMLVVLLHAQEISRGEILSNMKCKNLELQVGPIITGVHS
ncbi:hypothetical protein CR513_22922, partial [Mucuna pruriens]